MRFELSQEICDHIIFAMENQDLHYVFDSKEMQVVEEHRVTDLSSGGDGEGDEDRFLPLPDWKSVEGYLLMESFVAGLRNPLYRENLRRILQSGKGVFRQFKDALKERRDIERLWFRHKQREMRRRVYDWYNDLREYWGLAPLSVEQEVETDELLLSDFELGEAGPGLTEELIAWDKDLYLEGWSGLSEEELNLLYELRIRTLPAPALDTSSPVIVARTPVGDTAGFLWAVNEGTLISRVVQVGVLPEYRGLGMAKAMIHAHQKLCRERGFTRVLVEIPHGADFLVKSLEQEGFFLVGSLLAQGL